MPSTLDWKRGEDSRDTVHLIVQALVEGKVVGLPSETNYVLAASAVHAQAAGHVAQYAADRSTGLELMIRGPSEALDYCPKLSPVAARIVSRGLPGPLVTQLACQSPHSLAQYVAGSDVQELLCPDGFVGLRNSSHDVFSQVLQLMRGPIIVSDMLDATGQVIVTGNAAATDGPDSCNFVLNDNETHFATRPTLVQIDGSTCRVLRDGAIAKDKLLRLGQFVALVICTGNTCRSPMAEILLADLLVKRFPEMAMVQPRPFFVGSAGLSAFPGGPAASEAKKVMAKRGLSLAAHQSHSVTEHALRQADLVLTMTDSHRRAILERLPEMADKIHLVSGKNIDVIDPFGGTEANYAACADQIEGFLTSWVERMDESWFPRWQFD